MQDKDRHDMESTRVYEQSGARLAWLGLDDIISVFVSRGSEVFPAVLGMVHWLEYEIVISPSISQRFPHLLSPLSFPTITSEHEVMLSLSISPCTDHKLTPSAAYTKYSIPPVLHTVCTAYTEYCIHWLLHTLSTASSGDWLSPAPSRFLMSHVSSLISHHSSLGGYCYTQHFPCS